MIRRRAIVAVSPDKLFQLMGLKDATLLDVRVNYFNYGSVNFVVESPDMPEYRDEEEPRVIPLEDINYAV